MTKTYGAAKVNYNLRNDGRWAMAWKEAGQRKRTTFKGTEKQAEAQALNIARRIERSIGGIVIDYADHDLLIKLKEAAKTQKTTPNSLLQSILEQESIHDDTLLFSEIYKATATQYKSDTSKSPRTWSTMDVEFKAFNLKYPGMLINDISTAFATDWIKRNEASEQTFNNRLTMWRTLFNKSRARGHYHQTKSPVDTIEKRKTPSKIPPIFTLKELFKITSFLLKQNKKHHIAAFGIAIWSGMRPSEIQRLEWKHIDLKTNYIHADHNICKKLRHERYIPIHPCLKKLFTHIGAKDLNGRIIKLSEWRSLSNDLRDNSIIEKWPEDVTRHSYISYRLAIFGNVGEVANECGNSENIIKTRYRRPIKPAEGRKWFIFPPEKPEKNKKSKKTKVN
jgi:integrase